MESTEEIVEPEISDYEIERGKPLPSFNHGIVQVKIIIALSANKEFTIGSEITLNLTPKATPDVLVFKKRKVNWQHDEKRVSEMPLIAIEILSGTQGMDDFETKLQRYLDAGIQSVWLVQPFISTVAVFQPNQKPKVFIEGVIKDDATGISVNLDEIFES